MRGLFVASERSGFERGAVLAVLYLFMILYENSWP